MWKEKRGRGMPGSMSKKKKNGAQGRIRLRASSCFHRASILSIFSPTCKPNLLCPWCQWERIIFPHPKVCVLWNSSNGWSEREREEKIIAGQKNRRWERRLDREARHAAILEGMKMKLKNEANDWKTTQRAEKCRIRWRMEETTDDTFADPDV